MRLIDADALLKHEVEADRMSAMLVVGKGYILDAPTIEAVQVVRCRDCKYYWEYRTNKNKQIMRYCMRMAKNAMAYHVKPDDFCSYGEYKKAEV